MRGKYLDKYGRIWKLHQVNGGVLVVWNDEAGWGVWDNGKGLTLIID